MSWSSTHIDTQSTEGTVFRVSADTLTVAICASGSVSVLYYNNMDWVSKGTDIKLPSVNEFGYNCAISGNGSKLAIVSNETHLKYKGTIHFYDWVNNNWVSNGILTNSDASDTIFGFNLCLSSDASTLAVTEINTSTSNINVYIYINILLIPGPLYLLLIVMSLIC